MKIVLTFISSSVVVSASVCVINVNIRVSKDICRSSFYKFSLWVQSYFKCFSGMPFLYQL